MSNRVASSCLWMLGGVLGFTTSVVFRVEPVPWAIGIALGILAVLVGTTRLRPGMPAMARWSVALGVAWVPFYVALAVLQRDDVAALTTDVALAVLGAAAVAVGRGSSAA